MTELLFRDDAYARECTATVTAVNERGGIVLDRTVFYPTGGGQPGDAGSLSLEDGRRIAIATAVKGEIPDQVVHVPEAGQELPAAGSAVRVEIEWAARHRRMRIHTCLHLLSAVMPFLWISARDLLTIFFATRTALA